jgi:hypothetical protein
MGDVIRFITKAERDRARLIREARAIYDRIFPPTGPISEQLVSVPVNHTAHGANADLSDGGLLP